MRIYFNKLAFLETLLASASFLAIAVYAGTFAHIAITATLAPIVLLRSPESEAAGSTAFERFVNEISLTHNSPAKALRILVLTITGLFTRVFFSLLYFRSGFLNVPNNLFRVVSQERVFSKLEFVPGTGSINEILSGLFKHRPWQLFGSIDELIFVFFGLAYLYFASFDYSPSVNWVAPTILDMIVSVFFVVSAVTVGVIIFLVFFQRLIILVSYFLSFWYRFSLKATAIVWLPLVYLVWRAPITSSHISDHVYEEKEGALSALYRLIAWVSIIFLAWRAFVFPRIYDWWLSLPGSEYLNIFVLPIGTQPNSIHLFHIASGLNGAYVLAAYFFFIDKASRNLKDAKHIHHLARWYPRYYWSRGLLSIYTSVCGCYFVIQGALSLTWPSVSLCLFPWSCGYQ